MITVEKIREKYNENFIKELNIYKTELESILQIFLDKESKVYKMKDSISSRIKARDRLVEKINRKNYLEDWNCRYRDGDDIGDIVRKEIPDVIGFRLNCYFIKDEKPIMCDLQEFLSKQNKIRCNDDSKEIRDEDGSNEEVIFHKLSCEYQFNDKSISFEIQVKALMNDVWGEVDHEKKYKKTTYDSRQELMESLIKAQLKITKGLDSQLSKLFEDNISEEDIKKELFYFKTKDNIEDSYKPNIGVYYESFFNVLENVQHYEDIIDKYLGAKLIGEQFLKKKIHKNNESQEISDSLKKDFDNSKWDFVCKMMSLLFEFDNENQLLNFIINSIMEKLEKSDESEQEFGGVSEDAFGEENEECNRESETNMQIIKKRLGIILKEK